MGILILLCWLLALIFFGLAAFAIPSHPRFQWIAGGLFFLTLAMLLTALTGAKVPAVSG